MNKVNNVKQIDTMTGIVFTAYSLCICGNSLFISPAVSVECLASNGLFTLDNSLFALSNNTPLLNGEREFLHSLSTNNNKGVVINMSQEKEITGMKEQAEGMNLKPSREQVEKMKAQKEAQEKAQKEAQEKAQKEAQEKAQKEAQEKALLINTEYSKFHTNKEGKRVIIPFLELPSSNDAVISCREVFNNLNYRKPFNTTIKNINYIAIYNNDGGKGKNVIRYNFQLIPEYKDCHEISYTIEKKENNKGEIKFTISMGSVNDNHNAITVNTGKEKINLFEEDTCKLTKEINKLADMIIKYSETYSKNNYRDNNTRILNEALKTLRNKRDQIVESYNRI